MREGEREVIETWREREMKIKLIRNKKIFFYLNVRE